MLIPLIGVSVSVQQRFHLLERHRVQADTKTLELKLVQFVIAENTIVVVIAQLEYARQALCRLGSKLLLVHIVAWRGRIQNGLLRIVEHLGYVLERLGRTLNTRLYLTMWEDEARYERVLCEIHFVLSVRLVGHEHNRPFLCAVRRGWTSCGGQRRDASGRRDSRERVLYLCDFGKPVGAQFFLRCLVVDSVD